MEYGNSSIKSEKLYLYQGFDPATVNYPANELPVKSPVGVVNQRDADLIFLWQMVLVYFVLLIFGHLNLL